MIGFRRRKLAVALVSTIVLMGVWMGSSAVASAGEVLGGVAVGGVRVSGLQPAELMARLAPAARAVERRPLTLYVGDRAWTRTPEQMGVTVDLRRSAFNAMGAGRSSSFAWLWHSLASRERKLPWVPAVDQGRLNAAVQELVALVRIEASNGDFAVAGSEVKITPPADGIDLISSSARSLLINSSVAPTRGDRVLLPVKSTAPQIKLEQLERVKQQAEGVLSGPVEFLFQNRTLSVPAGKIAPTLKVSSSAGNAGSLSLSVDPAILKNQIIAANPGTQAEPKDASFSVAGDKVSIVPSVDGTTIDTTQAAAAVVRLSATDRRPITLPATVQPPAFTTEMAGKLGINQRIASFTTSFDARNAPRVGNIDRMAQAIDGKFLQPGETFSLNGATGARTVANGYQEAGILVDGELVPGIGGGVCQVATTLFNAVYDAGLQVVERSNHSLFISKYPKGRDAMVNFGVQDLRFRNDSEFGLLLKARVSGSGLSVSLYSSPLGRTVTQTVSAETNPRVPPVKYIDDPGLATGTETVTEEGIPGFDVTVTRVVRQGDAVVHSDKFVSKYKPWKRIIKKGTGPATAPAGTSTPALDVLADPSPAPGIAPDLRPAASPDPLAPTDLPPPPESTG
ncbi:MAG: VanW family protein [Actinomycetota bacterium]